MDPSTLKFSKTHEWVGLEGDVATIGISKFAVEQLTDLVYIELPSPGSTLTAGSTFGVVESVKAASDLYAPVSGEIIEVNDNLENDLDKLSDDPFSSGWMMKVRVSNPGELDAMMDHAAYQQHCENEAH